MPNKITVEGVECLVIFNFPVLYEGWECDSNAWVVEFLGERKAVMTNHGSKYFADIGELDERIDEYERVIRETEIAKDILKGAGR